MLYIPEAPNSIQKGVPLKNVLGKNAIHCLAHNLTHVYPAFPTQAFKQMALEQLEPLGIKERGLHIAKALREHLPDKYEHAIEIILASLTPPNIDTDGLGLAVFFYHPHSYFIAEYGVDAQYNEGDDPFEPSMKALYELTKRFTSEFSIRPFLMQHTERTLSRLNEWVTDPDPHVRRLCSEGTRPRLPWAPRLPAFIQDPTPILPLLERLKDDDSLYVRRSVANHLGDIAKDHPDLVFNLCEQWLVNATADVKWLIRHALRHPAKKQNQRALDLRTAAK